MERRHDPYSDERLLQMLEETSDISESDEETDQTYQQYRDDPESSDSNYRLEKVIAPKKNKAVNLVRLGVSDMLIQTRPSTSSECGKELIEVENSENEITPKACTIETEDGKEHVKSEKSETVNRQKKFPVVREIIQQAGVKTEKYKKQKKLTKINASKKPTAKCGRKQEKKKDGKVEKPKQQWKKRLFTSKIFPGALDPSLLQNPDPVRLPSEYFKDYISEEFYVRAANFTNMYAVRTTGRSVNTNSHELKIFIALHLLMGCFPFPRLRLYWQKGYSLPSVTEFMSRDRFLMLRNLFHLVDTENPEGHGINRLWKIQPIIDMVKDVCMRLPRDFRTYSIDEQMIPFTGRCPFRQFVRNKPRPVGLKVFVATASSGLVLDFVVYQGKTTELVNSEIGLGPSVVMTLVRTIPPESFVFFDRYFTSIPLLEKLESMGIEGTGTIMGNRVSGVEADSEDDSQLGRGQCNQYVSSNQKVVLVEWQDSKKVLMASTCFGSTPSEMVKRWSKKENQFIDVPCPPIVKNYNKCMGGVDVFNQQMECYRTFFRTRKWTWKAILHFIDFSIVNSWMLYVRDAKANKFPRKHRHDLLSFRLAVYEWLVHSSKESGSAILSDTGESDADEPIVKKSKFYNPPVKMPVQDKRYDGLGHWPVVDDIATPRACRMENCKSRSKVMCEKCKTYLCLSKQKNCFKLFHRKK